jgi:hypothetical protein
MFLEAIMTKQEINNDSYEYNPQQIFRRNDPISLFIFRLCVALQDHLVILKQFEAESKKTPEMKNWQLYTFLFKLNCSFAREAIKLFAIGEDLLGNEKIPGLKPQFTALLGSLPKQGIDMFQKLKEYYYPWEGSFSATVLKPIRDNTFHYETDTFETFFFDMLETGKIKTSKTILGPGTVKKDFDIQIVDQVFDEQILSYYRDFSKSHSSHPKEKIFNELADTILEISEMIFELGSALIYKFFQVSKGGEVD